MDKQRIAERGSRIAEYEIGQILAPEHGAIIREHIARVQSEATGEVYDCCVCAGNGLPAIRSVETNQWFLLTWAEIVELAIAAGIDRAPIEIRAESLVAHHTEVAHHGA